MPRVRKIKRNPNPGKNFFIVDSNFLANKYIPANKASNDKEKQRINKCISWWDEIDSQLKRNVAKVYIPDICIAETFKTLAKKYFQHGWFTTSGQLESARKKLRKDITISTRTLRSASRHIKYHDISTSRDIIIAVDRFYVLFMKHKKNVSLPDLILVATAKYLIDFFDLPKSNIHIITLDKALWEGSKKIYELPNAYDPTRESDKRDKVFI